MTSNHRSDDEDEDANNSMMVSPPPIEAEDDDLERGSDSGSSSSSSGANSSSCASGASSYVSGTGQSIRTGGESEDDTNSIKDTLGKQETKQVFRLRIVVVSILVSVALSISLAVYFLTTNAEAEKFETEYAGVAVKIIEHFQDILVQMSAVSGLAVAATIHAEQVLEGHLALHEEHDQMVIPVEWPFVALPDFQQMARNVRGLSGAIYVSINPIVEKDQLPLWESYIQGEANQWIDEGLAFQENLGLNDFDDPVLSAASRLTELKVDPLHIFNKFGIASLSQSNGPYLPRWQTSPVLESSMVNENIFEKPEVAVLAKECVRTKSAILGGFVTAPPGSTSHPDPTTSFFATLRSIWEGRQVEYLGDPMSHLVIPIFDKLHGADRTVVAVLKSTIHWKQYLRRLLPKTNPGVTVVVENKCDGNFTYLLEGDEAYPVGFGDLHDRDFSQYHFGGDFQTDVLNDGTSAGIPLNQDGCPYSFHVYATQMDYDESVSNTPIVICISIASVFVFVICMFFSYDALVERRQRLVLAKATESTALVSSIFPKQIRDRLIAMENDKKKGDAMMAPSHRLKSLANGIINEHADRPIADFFPNCTVLFSDISGFSAWSSTREPTQVFVLLQTVYQNFDIIAKRRRVFKVETIGDTYLAVTGLPEPQKHHVTIMAKFAWDCMTRMSEITKELEVSLGPDTGDLSMRFGIHSGSVTAGVLKGDRARFQLFGDTVNTAARMESTGMRGRIQVSAVSAHLLKKAGNEAWLTPRDDTVNIKGKGVVNTYWLALKNDYHTSSSVGSAQEIAEDQRMLLKPSNVDLNNRHQQKETRLVDWVADILLEQIKKVRIVHERCLHETRRHHENLYYEPPEGKICLDEVREAIHMPKFNAKVIDASLDSNMVEVPYEIVESLQDYVALIAKKYHRNPFHNFEHACHVTMSVNKLLSRVVAPDLDSPEASSNLKGVGRNSSMAADIHSFTHGLISDPLAVFAIVFSALIHDVDHQGISNAQLIKEQPGMGDLYRNKSLAEQNSLDVAWDIFMKSQFKPLREYIFKTRAEMMRFRQLIVNVVLATDIFDKELGDLRKARWERAFHGHSNLPETLVEDMRATIVMEHIIQASDVSHTMQHWHVYQKWNRNLFSELYKAWKAGRMGADPATFWYQGELGFFDNYIIPLAKKLRECNVFGVSSDEYLGYALKNRAEWEERGEQMLEQMIQECQDEAQTVAAEEPSASSGHPSVPETVSVQSHSSEMSQEEAKDETDIFDDIISMPSRTNSRAPSVGDNPLADSVTDILLKHLRKVVTIHRRLTLVPTRIEELSYESPDGTIFLDEMKEYINMPKFNARILLDANDMMVDVPDEIIASLREFVDEIARSYHEDNPFHNFEHACRVATSMDHLLSLVVPHETSAASSDVAPHNFSHGLTSDPLSAFALVFAALIHDVDHQGISNAQLVKEEPAMGNLYRHQSVTEQNSLDVAWDIFMSEQFDRLRQYIFVSRSEMLRFRQLLINVVLATDIFNKELNLSRNDRWQRAFHNKNQDESNSIPKKILSDLRATLVMEHMMQASNAIHTMRSWEEYQVWNRKLFAELSKAWKAGRMAANPAIFWYQGELNFLDFFVVPLAKKLQESRVLLGVHSEQFLERAVANRAQWETEGEAILKSMIGGADFVDSSAKKE